MDFLTKYNLTPGRVFKFIAVILVAVSVVLFVFVLLASMNNARSTNGVTFSSSMPEFYGGTISLNSGVPTSSYAPYSPGMPTLSTRNIAPGYGGGTTGSDAEKYEVSDYSATIESNDIDETCRTVAKLKQRTDVIFENASESDKNCSYRFKVEHKSVDEVLAYIKNLDPKNLTENTYTIKNQIEDFTSQTEILQKKLTSIDQTLSTALNAYDDITDLAVKTQNADALAKIVGSKVQMIQQLTQERLNVSSELDRLARAKAEQLDRLDYTYFSVMAYENAYVDLKAISDSWKASIQEMLLVVNISIERATVGVLSFLFFIIPLLIYGFLILVLAKYAWRLAKYIWGNQQNPLL